MKVTKWLSLFAVLALVLAACGGDDTTDTTVGGDAPATTADAGDDGTDWDALRVAHGPVAGTRVGRVCVTT